MYFVYKLLTYILEFLLPLYLIYRKLRNKEHITRYREKLSHITLKKNDQFLIWLHAASVGEVTSIFPLIENFEKNNKVNKILITTITLSSAEVVRKKILNNKKIIHQFLPLDAPTFVKKFLDHWSPNLSIFVDSEIWPNLIFEIKKKKIPLILLNGRLTKKTFNRWMFIKSFAAKIFEKFDLCFVSNNETGNFLKILGAKNIKNYGNLKFINNKTNNTLDKTYLNQIKNRNIWCAASTHPEEETFCAKTHAIIKKTHKNILTIIIPRHIERVKKIKKKLSKLNLKVFLFSELNKINNDTDILIVDVYGETTKFYGISKSVFLGKSLDRHLNSGSGQNPIEASRLGCRVFHGPNVSNFSEIYNYLKSLGITKEISKIKELSNFLIAEFDQNKTIDIEIMKSIEKYGQEILNNITRELEEYIKI